MFANTAQRVTTRGKNAQNSHYSARGGVIDCNMAQGTKGHPTAASSGLNALVEHQLAVFAGLKQVAPLGAQKELHV